jgi:hypothetical protein
MKVITANRLLDGDVVWLGENDVWVERVTLARTFDGKDDVAEGLSIGAAGRKRPEGRWRLRDGCNHRRRCHRPGTLARTYPGERSDHPSSTWKTGSGRFRLTPEHRAFCWKRPKMLGHYRSDQLWA